MNRFVKDNLILISVISGSLVAVCVLLVLTALEHGEMSKYSGEVLSLRETIRGLISKSPAPVEGNLELIQKDIDAYQKAARELEKIFSHPLDKALTAFVLTLVPQESDASDSKEENAAPKDDEARVAEFKKQFFDGWGKIDAAAVAQQGEFYRQFQRRFTNWDKAMERFREEAEKATTEPISKFRLDELFLSSLGVPRTMRGEMKQLKAFMRDYREKLISILDEKTVVLTADAADFSFSENAVYPVDSIPSIAAQWDVIGDLIKRIAASEVGSLTKFEKRSVTGETSGAYLVYHYSFEVTGKMEAFRKLAKLLDEGYKDSRFYIVRSVFLYSVSDPAEVLLLPDEREMDSSASQSQPEASAPQSGGRRGRRGGSAAVMQSERDAQEAAEQQRAAAEKRRKAMLEAEKKGNFWERHDYGDVLVGADQECRAIFDVDYVIFKGK